MYVMYVHTTTALPGCTTALCTCTALEKEKDRENMYVEWTVSLRAGIRK
jgi:hypothetical protein